jgi:hypothetical protein
MALFAFGEFDSFTPGTAALRPSEESYNCHQKIITFQSFSAYHIVKLIRFEVVCITHQIAREVLTKVITNNRFQNLIKQYQ